MRMRPIYDHIIFQFEDNVVNGVFQESTDFGFILNPSHESSRELSRWATICELGPDCSDKLEVGQRVLVSKGMWTNGFKVNDQTFWRTEEKHILAIGE